jgi:hypothetical protein
MKVGKILFEFAVGKKLLKHNNLIKGINTKFNLKSNLQSFKQKYQFASIKLE